MNKGKQIGKINDQNVDEIADSLVDPNIKSSRRYQNRYEDTTANAGDSDIEAGISGKPIGETNDKAQTIRDDDTAGGMSTGDLGGKIGYDGITDVGDVDPELAEDVINADTDGSQAGQVGHPGIDEGTE